VTPHALAHSAYAQSSAAIPDPRRIEYTAFAKVTQMLVNAAADTADLPAELAAAVHQNRRLWINIATLVADADNKLPNSLRARLFYLSQFVSQHSAKVLSEDASVSTLIDVNRSIMAGLAMQEAAR
jgi:flagellar protein FlaF